MGCVIYLIHWRGSFNPLTRSRFSPRLQKLHISHNNRGSPYSIVSSRFCTLSCSDGDGIIVVIRDSLLYAVTWQARKGRLEIPGSRSGASSYNSTRMRTSSRIRITITTYIYVGESLGSQEDPFTARNREFRVTLRGPKRRHWIWWLYTYAVDFIL